MPSLLLSAAAATRRGNMDAPGDAHAYQQDFGVSRAILNHP